MTVYFLVGPTASGKTKFSLNFAKKLNAEIISCDSMCVYKGMDILTSKPEKGNRKKVRHHLIDIISPTQEFSAAKYRDLALNAIEDILHRGKTPLFVGGSGLYVKSVIDGLFPSAKKDSSFRDRQTKLAEKYGGKYLYGKLKRIDPVTAARIHHNDLRRIIRALEIYHTEKKKPSEIKERREPLKYDFKIFGLDVERGELYRNIEDRVESMFKNGILAEVRELSKKNLSLTAKNALGYHEVFGYLEGRYSLDEAKALLKKNTRHFAKRQMTWFKAEPRIEWIKYHVGDP